MRLVLASFNSEAKNIKHDINKSDNIIIQIQINNITTRQANIVI